MRAWSRLSQAGLVQWAISPQAWPAGLSNTQYLRGRESLPGRRLRIRLPLSCEFLRFGDLVRCHLVGGVC
jgi:hypothetical protein